MLFCLAFSLFVACLPHCTGTGIIQYTLARLNQQLKVHRHGQIGFLSFCLFAQLRLIAHCSPFAVSGNTPCIVSFIQIPTRLIHQQCPLDFHCRNIAVISLLYCCNNAVFHIFPFCCIFAAVTRRSLFCQRRPSLFCPMFIVPDSIRLLSSACVLCPPLSLPQHSRPRYSQSAHIFDGTLESMPHENLRR